MNTTDTYTVKQFKTACLREAPAPERLLLIDTPDKALEAWQTLVATCPWFNAEVEQFVCLFLNTRKRLKGFELVSQGTVDTLLVHPREVFRTAIVLGAAAIIVAHNHPSGDPSPSEADIRCTRELVRAGQILKIEVLDHVIVGVGKRTSLRELGYFAA